jgi:hypothetical protein
MFRRPSSRNRTVEATIYVELEGPEIEGHEVGEIEVKVTGTAIPYTPARFRGHPDTWSPAEGGGIEDFEATVDGQPFELSRDEEERAVEALQERAADAAEADAEAWAEAEGEAREMGW